jgi:hypothetical protein
LQQAVRLPECKTVHLTVVFGDHDCDTTMQPLDPATFARVGSDTDVRQTEKGIEFEFQTFERVSLSE